MAQFARLDSNNNVLEVLVVDNEDITDTNGNEVEQLGIDFLEDLFGYSLWKQTSSDSSFRKRYANIGYKYNEECDCFCEPSPDASWVLNPETCEWEEPTE